MVHNDPDIDLVSDNEYTSLVNFCPFILIIWGKNQSLMSIKGHNCVVNLRKQRFTFPMQILSMIMCVQNLVSICLYVLKIWSKNLILTSIKGRNSVANLQKNNDLQQQGRSCQ